MLILNLIPILILILFLILILILILIPILFLILILILFLVLSSNSSIGSIHSIQCSLYYQCFLTLFQIPSYHSLVIDLGVNYRFTLFHHHYQNWLNWPVSNSP